MRSGLSQRAAGPEWMDQAAHNREELREALRHLRRLNRIFGAARPVLYGVDRLWRTTGRPPRLTVLDVGSGSGDINRKILSWARRRGVEIQLTLCDVTEEAEAEAMRLYGGDQRVVFVRRDLFELPDCCADLVTASQFAHHFAPDRLPGVVRRMMELARRGVVLSDIHRHWMPWTAVWAATRLVSRNRYIRHDGPLSVAKGFRRQDFQSLAGTLGLVRFDVRWRPLFRWVVTIPVSEPESGGAAHEPNR